MHATTGRPPVSLRNLRISSCSMSLAVMPPPGLSTNRMTPRTSGSRAALRNWAATRATGLSASPGAEAPRMTPSRGMQTTFGAPGCPPKVTSSRRTASTRAAAAPLTPIATPMPNRAIIPRTLTTTMSAMNTRQPFSRPLPRPLLRGTWGSSDRPLVGAICPLSMCARAGPARKTRARPVGQKKRRRATRAGLHSYGLPVGRLAAGASAGVRAQTSAHRLIV